MGGDGSGLPFQDVPEGEYEFELPAETRPERWVLFDAGRWTIVAIILGGVLATLLVLGRLGVLVYHNENTAILLLSVLVAGNFTLLSVVVTINQLVLTREFGKPHELRERNEGIRQFRRDVLDLLDEPVGSPDPLRFLRALVVGIDEQASTVRSAVADTDDERLREQADDVAASVDEQTTDLESTFDDAQFGDFDVLVALLFYRSAWQIHAVRRLRHEYEDVLSPAAVDALDRQEELLHAFTVAREYVQTLYLQNEVATLSRLLLYVGLPSLFVVSFAMLMYLEGAAITIGQEHVLVAFSLVGTVAFAPLALVLSYLVRISTIVSRMPLLSPFLTDG